jgi:hypothetical protein
MKRGVLCHARTLLLCACLLVGGSILAAGSGAGGDAGTKPEQRPSAQRQEGAQKPAPKPARTFKPTEKIRADSAVSFPVDI